jgi:pimeloyl-ACP methyl ester carboxylesterase/DNA-binding SARP family transcriptional activator
MPLTLQLLGQLAVSRDGRALPLPPSVKTRALLAYLAMNPRGHRRQQLADLLWDVADDPRGGLRWCLSRLRPLLDDDEHTRLVSDRETIRVDAAALDIDARHVLDARIDELSVEALEALSGRIHGEFCEGIELPDFYGFHAWCIGLRQDLRRRHARMRARLVDLLSDRPERALTHSRLLCQLTPEAEASHAAHIRVLRRLGDGRQAGEYERAARRLLKEQYGAAQLPLLDRALDGGPPPNAATPAPADLAAEPPRQVIRYCRSVDGACIAYAEVGEGPRLVKVANWISHLEHEFRSPVWRHLIRELARDHRLVRYDQRGNGLSERKVADVSGARQLEDLEAVMDAAGCERVPLLGVSQGCSIAIDYAVRHPERVSHLVLYGGFALGWRKHGDGLRTAGTALATMMRTGWGHATPAFRQIWTSLFIPRAPREAADWFNEMQRIASDGETASRLFLALGELDVRDKLGEVRCPTLVLHVEGDQVVPIAEGKRMAAGIPGARFVSFAGENHLPLESDACFPQIMEEIRRFLAE